MVIFWSPPKTGLGKKNNNNPCTENENLQGTREPGYIQFGGERGGRGRERVYRSTVEYSMHYLLVFDPLATPQALTRVRLEDAEGLVVIGLEHFWRALA